MTLVSSGDPMILKPFSIQGDTIPLLDEIVKAMDAAGADLARLRFHNKSAIHFPFFTLAKVSLHRGKRRLWLSIPALAARNRLFRVAKKSGFGTTLANGVVHAAPQLEGKTIELLGTGGFFAVTDGASIHPVFTARPGFGTRELSAHELMEWATAFGDLSTFLDAERNMA